MDIKSGIYTKAFEYEDKDGIRQKVLLRPLKVIHLKDLFKVVNKFKDLKKTDKETDSEFSSRVLDLLDADTVGTLGDLCLATITSSVEGISEGDANEFVSSHFMELFPVIIELNMSNGKKA